MAEKRSVTGGDVRDGRQGPGHHPSCSSFPIKQGEVKHMPHHTLTESHVWTGEARSSARPIQFESRSKESLSLVRCVAHKTFDLPVCFGEAAHIDRSTDRGRDVMLLRQIIKWLLQILCCVLGIQGVSLWRRYHDGVSPAQRGFDMVGETGGGDGVQGDWQDGRD